MVKRAIKDKGKRPSMLIDGSQVRELVIFKTFELLFRSWAKKPTDDLWVWKCDAYEKAYNVALAALVIAYDADQSGTMDGEEAGEAPGLGTITAYR